MQFFDRNFSKQKKGKRKQITKTMRNSCNARNKNNNNLRHTESIGTKT